MLDSATKRRIDTARDILVGKVPDPKSQVEQITIALIYKFMDDMDAQSEQLGGKRSFFADGFTRYGWTKLMRTGLGGHDTLNLYTEAITRMPENPGIPPLFRDIFKNAYLPYRDPETLRNFLKVIDEFEYDHSERLGDAFEYLLSILGSQGDAGQFRTPRHVIDFIVAVIDPKKDETLLDPACGTAGFLISSYKHVIKANTDKHGHGTLTPDEKRRLADNFKGYDISPDMVRLSLVNMYLHGFAVPHIFEYDTLTSQDRWNDYADVILANPPFMSPKGGIRPHNRFSVKSKRSEVLFVDYMAEHLTPNGRAGIIVPEGIIFQSQNAHKQLRKMLVEGYLVAVVSLPAGVFQPYSGVKTSILILDRSLAKKTDHIGFFKVENDGFDLGAQRRKIDKDDLPQAHGEISAYLHRLRAEESMDDFQPALGLIVAKEKVAADGEYNLSGERYRENDARGLLKWPLVKVGEMCIVERGASPRPIHDFITDSLDGVNWIKIGDARVGSKFIFETAEKITQAGAAKSRWVKSGDLILSNSMSYGRPYIMATDGCIHDGWLLLRKKFDRLDGDFLYYILGSKQVFAQFKRAATGGVVNNLNSGIVRNVEIPLPPLEVQREIVAEIEGYQKVIDGARAVIDNYRPHIPINPDWPMVKLGEVAEVIAGQSPPGKFYNDSGVGTPFYQGKTEFGEMSIGKPKKWTTGPQRFAENGDILMSVRAPVGPVNLTTQRICIGRGLAAIRPMDGHRLLTTYAFYVLRSLESVITGDTGAIFASINKGSIKKIEIPLPPLEVQREIVAEIEAEQKLVAANRELVERMEQKIQTAISQMWKGNSVFK